MRKMIRGFNDKIFYITKDGESIVVNQIRHHPNMIGSVIHDEVYTLDDRTAVAFELDSENQQDDFSETVT